MSRTLPPRPHPEQLKKQAKDLLKSYQSQQQDAIERVQRICPDGIDSASFRLSDAQRLLAREYGFPNWAQLRAHVEAHNAQAQGASQQKETPPPPKWSVRMVMRADAILALARQGDVKGVLMQLYAIRTGDLLTVRDLLWQSGEYALVVDALLQGLELPQPNWRYEAAGMMDRLADERCYEPLRRLLYDPIPRIRRIAMHAMTCDHCKITPLAACSKFLPEVIRLALTDPSVQVRRHTVYILAENHADPKAIETLHTMLAQETDAKILQDVRSKLARLGLLPDYARF